MSKKYCQRIEKEQKRVNDGENRRKINVRELLKVEEATQGKYQWKITDDKLS
jgi:hypothetical protein